MIFVFGALAFGLAIAAYKSRDSFIRWFLVACCLANLAGIAKAIATDDPYAFRLHPNDGTFEPSYRRP